MNAITIRLPEELMNEVKAIALNMHISRGEYIRKSIEQMNKIIHEKERAARLIKASQKVRANSMIVNAEFDKIEHDPEA